MAGDGVDQVLRVVLLLEQLERLARVAGARDPGTSRSRGRGGCPSPPTAPRPRRTCARRRAWRPPRRARACAGSRTRSTRRRAPRPRLASVRPRAGRLMARRNEPLPKMAFDTLSEPAAAPTAAPPMEKFVIEGGQPLSGTVSPGRKQERRPAGAGGHPPHRGGGRAAQHPAHPRRGGADRSARGPRRRGRVARATTPWSSMPPASPRPTSTRPWPSASAPRSCSPARCWPASAAPTCRRPGAT